MKILPAVAMGGRANDAIFCDETVTHERKNRNFSLRFLLIS